MCTETRTTSVCTECGDTIGHTRDVKMCRKGRKENEWGACGHGTVEHRILQNQLCEVCKARKRFSYY
ncbi:hypothetical protein FAVG1_04601 [Fusarium avenaceum]|nr:hypothetical protein FAVG1_04601 [Fusarium avenaceum]